MNSTNKRQLESWFNSVEEKEWTQREIAKMSCASHLVESLMRANAETQHEDISDFSFEEITNRTRISEDAPTFRAWLEENWGDDQDINIDEEAELEESSYFWSDYETELEDHREEVDIFEWWLVDSWMAGQLGEIGETTLSAGGLHFWGRTCTGQAIELDGTIQQVKRHLEANIARRFPQAG